MRLARTRAELADARAELAAAHPGGTASVGLVPTMGALHAGHAALIERARAENGSVVVSVFVNPLQFGPHEDLERYPRPLDHDLQLAERIGADLVWAPTVEDVYASGSPQVTVDPGPLGDQLEGASRVGHFGGVLTVVSKLVHLVRPERVYFGEKDYQQLVLVRRMVLDLDMGVQVVGVPTVRDADGLALSSRNVYLSPDERTSALALSRALRTGSLDAARAELAAHPDVEIDYLELRDADLAPAVPDRPARLLVAARVGATRLIDNMAVPS